MILMLLFTLIGFGASLYAFFIEQKLKKDAGYKPVCDVSERASCTRALLSEYSKTFNIPNSIIGILFYAVVALFALLGWYKITLLLSVAGMVMTLWFAYLLYFRLKIFCFVCTTIYIANIGLLITNIYQNFKG